MGLIAIELCEISQLVCSWNICSKGTWCLADVHSTYQGKLMKLLNAPPQVPHPKILPLFPFLRRRLGENHQLYQTPTKEQLPETLFCAIGAGVLFLPQILATEHFSTPGQTLLTTSYSNADSISRQAWVWLPVRSQQSICSGSWPQRTNLERQVGRVIATFCITGTRSPISHP